MKKYLPIFFHKSFSPPYISHKYQHFHCLQLPQCSSPPPLSTSQISINPNHPGSRLMTALDPGRAAQALPAPHTDPSTGGEGLTAQPAGRAPSAGTGRLMALHYPHLCLSAQQHTMLSHSTRLFRGYYRV